MHRSIISDEASQDLDDAISLSLEFGFEGIEIRSVDGCPPHDLNDNQLAQIRDRLAAHGLAISAFCPPALKGAIPTTLPGILDATRLVARSLDQAVILGTPNVRIFSFYRDGPDPQPEAAAQVARQVLQPLDLPSGVRLLLETGTRTNTPTLQLARRFLDELGDPRIGILWDPGNTVFSGFDPRPFPHELEGAPLVDHVHVKDPDGTRGYVGLGNGDLPWPDILSYLITAGYEGWITLETHWRMDRVLTGQERDQPWGSAISTGGLAASRECMRRLNAFLAPYANGMQR